jgi:DNA-binding response OmpR family regulator
MTEQPRILVVDDEPDLLELIRYNLVGAGFQVTTSADGLDALERTARGRFNLVVLDLMLPGLPGTEVCRSIRANPSTATLPVIMLTARSEDSDKITGLEIGADDYMTKPFNPRELVARIKAIIRRAPTASAPESPANLAFGQLEIRKDEYRVMLGGAQVDLSPTEYRLLVYLAERRGKVFNRDQLLNAVWEGDAFVEPRTVDVHIRRIRKQIEPDPATPYFIKTRRGVGYYFEGGT